MKNMFRKVLALTLVALFSLTVLAGCGSSSSGSSVESSTTSTSTDSSTTEETTAEPTIENITYESRGVQVPATVVMPAGDGPFAFVVMCHGHGGNRDEALGYPAIAEALAENNIATIRMDYSGCGESTESFTDNNLTNMKEDTLNAVQYMIDNYNVDENKVGIFGYSMGGRIVLELLADDSYDFQAAAMLAPAADTDDLKNLFGGADSWESLKEEANSDKGYADWTTIYGQEQQLGKQWFDDLEANPGATIVDKAAANCDIPTLVIHALDDEAVSPSVSLNVAEKLGSQLVQTPEDGHSYGFYSDKTAILNEVVYSVDAFFDCHLNAD
ncbi:MAG: alpha/beta hydrolase family protein [Oscillospiraceae bacterium]